MGIDFSKQVIVWDNSFGDWPISSDSLAFFGKPFRKMSVISKRVHSEGVYLYLAKKDSELPGGQLHFFLGNVLPKFCNSTRCLWSILMWIIFFFLNSPNIYNKNNRTNCKCSLSKERNMSFCVLSLVSFMCDCACGFEQHWLPALFQTSIKLILKIVGMIYLFHPSSMTNTSINYFQISGQQGCHYSTHF